MWHVTCDAWHVTRDTWHMTHDMFGGVNILSKFQLPSSYRLWFMILWRSGGEGSLTQRINEWMNYEAVYRTAPATPGLLITLLAHTFRIRLLLLTSSVLLNDMTLGIMRLLNAHSLYWIYRIQNTTANWGLAFFFLIFFFVHKYLPVLAEQGRK